MVGLFLLGSIATTLDFPAYAVAPVQLGRWLILACAGVVSVNRFLRLPLTRQGAAWLMSGLYAAGTVVYSIDIPSTVLRSGAFFSLAAAAFLGGFLCYRAQSPAPHRLPSRAAVALACLTLVSIAGLAVRAPASFFHETGLFRGIFCHANALGSLGAMSLAVCVGVYDGRLTRYRRLVLAGIFAMLISLVASGSRAGVGGAIIGVLLYVLATRRMGRLLVAGALLGTLSLSAFILLPFASNVATREGGDFIFKGNEGDFFLSRRSLWEEGWDNFLGSPWFGYGFGTSVGEEPKGWKIVGLGGREKGSAFIAILEETGIVGAFFMGLPALFCMASFSRVRRLNVSLSSAASGLVRDARLAAAFWAGAMGGLANNLAEGSLWSPGSPYGGILLFLAGASEGLVIRTEERT